MIFDVADYYGPHPDYRALSNSRALPYNGARANMRAFPNINISAKDCARRDVRVRPDRAIVVYACAGIDDCIRSYPGPRLHDSSGKYLRTRIDTDPFAYDRARIRYRSKAIT
jgi:hypothetical protein